MFSCYKFVTLLLNFLCIASVQRKKGALHPCARLRSLFYVYIPSRVSEVFLSPVFQNWTIDFLENLTILFMYYTQIKQNPGYYFGKKPKSNRETVIAWTILPPNIFFNPKTLRSRVLFTGNQELESLFNSFGISNPNSAKTSAAISYLLSRIFPFDSTMKVPSIV